MPGEWAPSGVVTLTTDFGVRDPYVGIMKGVVASRAPRARCVDLTHAVPPQDVRVAGFHLAHAWRWFPAGTVHVAVVDPGVGTERRILVAEQDGHAFLAPDNGLLDGVLGDGARVVALAVERFALSGASATFHGRDVFAPAAAAIAAGHTPGETGEAILDWRRGPGLPVPRRLPDVVATEVLFADHFGNLVSALVPDEREGDLDAWVVAIAGKTVPTGRTYAAVAPGELVALVDSFGHLEVAVRDGDAASALGAGPGTPLELRRKTT